MLYMILIKASTLSEQQHTPSKTLMQEMDTYNDQLEASGIKVMAKGLYPTSHAYRVHFDENSQPQQLVKGPFLPSEDQLAGFFLIEVQTEEDALHWFKKVPDPIGEGQGSIELRRVY